MASVQICKWEVAEMFGLEYLGQTPWDRDKCTLYYKFKCATGSFQIEENGWDCENEQQAKERAAEKLFAALAKLIVV